MAQAASTSKAASAALPHEIEVTAFGTSVVLHHGVDSLEQARRLDWLKDGCEMFLASRSLPKAGLCVQIGAGDGWMALPFAKAFPNWTVLCFEADPAAFARLEQNVAALGLDNVTCVAAGFHPDLPEVDVKAPTARGLAAWAKGLSKHINPQPFQRLMALGGRLEPVPQGQTGTFEDIPALPLSILRSLPMDLLVLDAPGCEAEIASTLRDCPVSFMLGQLYDHVLSGLFNPTSGAGPREYYLQCGDHVLRRDFEDNFVSRRPSLDVVVAMYNTADYIEECVDSLLADGNDEIRVLVVNDGSTDGCEALVAKRYADNPRVVLLNKPNGGCASARNYGRAHSDATHIAFIDADDRVDPGMFTALLEVGRYTGAFVVEGEFQFFYPDRAEEEQLVPSYEAEIFSIPGDWGLGPYNYTWIPGGDVAVGQPTIWRRIYRRDFLDRKKIYFPEHIRAFDDQIFQLLIAQYCGSLAHVQGYGYHYRQHPAQDIKQGDERHFYSFNMFRSIILRSLDESWTNLDIVVHSLLNTMRWSYGGLRDDLKGIYQEAATEFLVTLEKTYGMRLEHQQLLDTGIDGLDFTVERKRTEVAGDDINYGMMRLESWRWQPEMIRMHRDLQTQ